MRLAGGPVVESSPGQKSVKTKIHSWQIPWLSGSESFYSKRSSLAWSLYEANMLREVESCVRILALTNKC